jgi:hypothetical protein
LPPVGNDIVDLKEPDNCGKSGDDRFLSRVFTQEERDRIVGAANPDTLLWALWAAKEAAYKAVSHDAPLICSTPRRYAVTLDDQALGHLCEVDGANGGIAIDGRHGRQTGKGIDSAEGMEGRLVGRVITPLDVAALCILITEEYVHALAISGDGDLAALVHRVGHIDIKEETDGASAVVREQLLSEIARRLGCPIGDLEIRKEPVGPGAPSVFLRGRPLPAEISLSHDGRFTAFAFRLPR